MGVRRADGVARRGCGERMLVCAPRRAHDEEEDRKSTRLNSSHDQISYAVFCLKKKKKKKTQRTATICSRLNMNQYSTRLSSTTQKSKDLSSRAPPSRHRESLHH